MATKKANGSDRRYVLVTTDKRGVFAGYLEKDADYNRKENRIKLSSSRNCVYWTADTRGFLGLASHGPGKGCRVGPAAVDAELAGVTSVTTCTEEARERWESAPW